MSALSGTRASYQPKPNVPGFGKRAKRRVASNGELAAIAKAVTALNKATKSTNEEAFLLLISDAFRLSRDIFRGRSV